MDKDQNPPAPLDTRDDQIKIEEETVDNLNASVSVQARENKAYAKRRSNDLCQATQEEPDGFRIVHQVNYEKPANIFTPEALNVTHHFPDLRSCGCSPPCVFSPPELPDIKTKSPTQLLKIMTLYPDWKKDQDDGLIEDLLLVSQLDIPVPIPGKQFFRAVARCSNIHEFVKEVKWTEAFFKVTHEILRERGVNVFEEKSSSAFPVSVIETGADNSDDEQMDETNNVLDEQDSVTNLLDLSKMSINSTEKPTSSSKIDADQNIDKSGIHVMLHNVHGCTKQKTVQQMCEKFNASIYDILAINESWLNDTHSSSMFEQGGLSLLRCDRNPYFSKKIKSSGGGVAILYKPSVSLSIIDIDMPNYYEHHRCEIIAILVSPSSPSRLNEPFTLVTVYRPPDTNAEEVKKLIDHLESFLPDERCALIGDFNFKDETVTIALPFFEFCKERKMDQKVDEYTRVPTPSKLDLVFVSSDLNIPEAIVLDDKLIKSDHKPVYFSIPLTPCSTELSSNLSSSQSLSESNSKPVPHLDQAKHSDTCRELSE